MPVNEKLVVTIPADLELSDAEKSMLGKGLTFVPVERKLNEYRTKANCEKFYRLRLKPHFHGPYNDDTVVTPDNCFAKFNGRISTWTPPEGEFSAVDHYIDHCLWSVGALNSEAGTSYNNLLQVEKEALKTLTY